MLEGKVLLKGHLVGIHKKICPWYWLFSVITLKLYLELLLRKSTVYATYA